MALNNKCFLDLTSGGYFDVPVQGLAVGDPDLGDFTIEGWINVQGGYYLWSSGAQTSQKGVVLSYQNGSRHLSINGSSFRVHATNIKMNLNEWTHYAMSWDYVNKKVYYYVDGILEGTFTGSSGGNTVTNNILRINMPSNTASYAGIAMYDELRVWRYRRTSEQINKNKDKKLSPTTEGLVRLISFDECSDTEVVDQVTGSTYPVRGVAHSRWGEVDLYHPIEIITLHSLTVPRHGGNLTFTINDLLEVNLIKFKVELVSPMYRLLRDWEEYGGGEVSVDLPIDLYEDFNERKVRITVNAGNYTAVKEVASYLANTAPQIEIVNRDYDLAVNIRDAEDDPFNYKVTLNGKTIFPYDKDVGYSDKPVTLYRKLGNSDLIFGEGNVVKVTAVDKFGMQAEKVLIIKGDYYGLLFADEDKEYYSTNLGEVLKRMRVTPLVAGEVAQAHKVLLINNQSAKVRNVNLRIDYSDEVPHTNLKLSKTEQPFIPQDELVWAEAEAQQELEFYVKIFTNKNAYGKGKFKLTARAEFEEV